MLQEISDSTYEDLLNKTRGFAKTYTYIYDCKKKGRRKMKIAEQMDTDSEERSMVEKTEDDESLDINIRDTSTKELYIKRQ